MSGYSSQPSLTTYYMVHTQLHIAACWHVGSQGEITFPCNKIPTQELIPKMRTSVPTKSSQKLVPSPRQWEMSQKRPKTPKRRPIHILTTTGLKVMVYPSSEAQYTVCIPKKNLEALRPPHSPKNAQKRPKDAIPVTRLTHNVHVCFLNNSCGL